VHLHFARHEPRISQHQQFPPRVPPCTWMIASSNMSHSLTRSSGCAQHFSFETSGVWSAQLLRSSRDSDRRKERVKLCKGSSDRLPVPSSDSPAKGGDRAPFNPSQRPRLVHAASRRVYLCDGVGKGTCARQTAGRNGCADVNAGSRRRPRETSLRQSIVLSVFWSLSAATIARCPLIP
jgi:hypothetical protein